MAVDINTLADQVAVSIKGYIADRLKAIEVTFAELIEQKFAAMPKPKDGKDAPVVDVGEVVKFVLEKIPTPKHGTNGINGEKGKDGKDGEDAPAVDIGAVVKMVLAEVPRPKDGKDADQEAIVKSVLAEVTEVLDSISVPKDGKDGKDADPVLVAQMVATEVAKIPRPENGKDADVAAISKAVEQSVLAAIRQPEDGQDGKDIDPVVVKAFVAAEVAEAVSKIRVPVDGKDIDPQEVRVAIADEVQRAVAKIPKPTDGKDFDPELIRLRVAEILPGMVDKAEAFLSERLEAAVAKLPKPKDGEDGTNGKDYDQTVLRAEVILAVKHAVAEIPPAPAGKDANPAEIAAEVFDRLMKSIRMPADGKSVTIDEVKPLLEGEVSRWELEFERRAADLIQRSLDKIRKPVDGVDGFSLDDFDAQIKDGGRILMLKFRSGEREIVREMKLGIPIYRGVFKTDASYELGDTATYGGSLWVAKKDSPGTPGDGIGWQLAVKKGSDGKDGGS